MTPLHRAARAYARHVGPVYAGVPRAKCPIRGGGLHTATRDPAVIDRVWGDHPEASVILACTPDSGLVAIDIDVDRVEAWVDVLRFGRLPIGPVQHSGGGGQHLLFRRPPGVEMMGRVRGRADHPEVKGNGSIHLSPSVHPSGERYRWERGLRPHLDVEVPMMPDWLVALCRRPDEPDRRGSTAVAPSDVDVVTRARAYVARMDPAISGQGGHAATFRVAVALVRSFGLDPDEAMPILRDYSSRCDPPWSERELRHKVRQAGQRSRLSWGYLRDAERSAAA